MLLLSTVARRSRSLLRPLQTLPLAGLHRPLSSSVQQPQQPSAASSSPSSAEGDSSVLVERRPIPGHNAGYLVLTLNRPKQSNALDMALLHELQGVFDTLAKCVYRGKKKGGGGGHQSRANADVTKRPPHIHPTATSGCAASC